MCFSPRSTFLVFSLVILASLSGLGQDPHNPLGTLSGIDTVESHGAIVRVIVRGEDHKLLDQQAVVRLNNLTDKTNYNSTTDDRAQAILPSLSTGKYDVEISSFGYVTQHLTQLIGTATGSFPLEIVLKHDPAAVNLNDVASKLSPKVRKQVQRGVTYLKSGDFKRAEKELQAAERDEPASPEISFLLGYLYLQRKENDSAKKYLEQSAAADPRNVQTLTMLGKLYTAQKDYAGARKALEQAVAIDPDAWNAQYLLGNSCLLLKDYAPASEHAQIAIAKGKGAAGEAYLVLGQSEAHLNHNEPAILALQSYLQHNPSGPNTAQVQSYITWLEHRAEDVKKGTHTVATTTFSVEHVIQAEDNIDELRLAAKGWAPVGVDDAKPAVAADTPCQGDQVVTQAGKRVKELVENVSKFAATEDVMHENLDAAGHAVSHENRRFDYSVEISESQGFPGVDEYRAAHGDVSDFPDNIATRGFPTLAMVFHPSLRDDFQMTCEGLGQWKNQATWLVYFRQRDDKPNRIHDYRVGPGTYPADLKGRAWIAAENFQIVHIESELVSPNRKIQLLTEHQVVDYGPVLFAARKEQLWLPKNADIYMDFQRKRFHRRHSFDHFLLFAVESNSKDKAPVANSTVDKPQPPADQGPKQ